MFTKKVYFFLNKKGNRPKAFPKKHNFITIKSEKESINLLLFQRPGRYQLNLFLISKQPQEFELHERPILRFCDVWRLLSPSKPLDQVSE